MLKIHIFEVNNFGENTYIAVDTATNEAAVIDPGFLLDGEADAFDRFVKDNGIAVTQVILTHAHLDHCFGVGHVVDKYGVPVKGHILDRPLAASVRQQAARFGMAGVFKQGVDFDVTLTDGDIIEIGRSRLQVVHTPGHSPGGIVLYDSADNLAFVGDSIFEQSIGRTDLEGGDYDTLISSLKSKVLSLPPETMLLPGHGRPTTVAAEAAANPFLKL